MSRYLKIPGIFRPALPVLAIILIAGLCYGPQAPWLGFYKDDWRTLWTYYALGSQGLLEQWAGERPYAGYLYLITTPLLGFVPVHWHLFALISRIACGISVWLLLKALIPRQERSALSIAILFTVQPAYTQYVWAYTHSHIVFHMAVVLSSLAALAWSFKTARFRLLLQCYSILSCIHGLFQFEYQIGLEAAARPLVIWLMLGLTASERGRERLKRMVVLWVPYLVALLAFIAWRVFIYKPTVAGPYDAKDYLNNLLHSPFSTLTSLLRIAVSDVVELLLFAWAQTFNKEMMSSGSVFVACWLLVLCGSIICFAFLMNERGDCEGSNEATRTLLYLGAVSFVGGMAPFWLVERNLTLASNNDRFALGGLFGASILIYAIIRSICRNSRTIVVVVSILCGFSCGFHFLNMNDYRRDWRAQKDILWQIAWRVPDLEPGTSIILTDLPLIDRRGFSMSTPVNLLYDSADPTSTLRHWVVNASIEIGYRTQKFDETTSFFLGYFPGFTYEGSPSKAIVLSIDENRQVEVLSPRYYNEAEPLKTALAHFSQPGLVKRDEQADFAALEAILGPEPAHGWLYYYQKAKLAAQFEDWEHVGSLLSEVKEKKLSPQNPKDWLVFIEAELQLGDTEEAQLLAERALGRMSVLRDFVLRLDRRVSTNDAGAGKLNMTIDQDYEIQCWWPNEDHVR